MAELYDISGWSEQPWWNTGGTRNKKVYLNPDDGKLYYFKQSFNKGKRNYTYEFWSEIVASEVGQLLEFNLLPYHIAIRGNVIGCISESMIDPASEELVEGGKYLQAFDNTFDPEDVKLRDQYSFQLILESLEAFKLDRYVGDILDTLSFDALIGNSDRHQENWAIINSHSNISRSLSEMEKELKKIEGREDQISSRFGRWMVKKFYTVKGKIRPEFSQVRLLLAKETRFAPIYDSGCSFGRELMDEKVKELLNSQKAAERYLDKGLAEIHWEGNKINHFELLEKILNERDFKTMLLESMERIIKKYDGSKLEDMIENIDLPLKLKELGKPFRLPDERKAMMIKLLALRHKKIADLYRQYKK